MLITLSSIVAAGALAAPIAAVPQTGTPPAAPESSQEVRLPEQTKEYFWSNAHVGMESVHLRTFTADVTRSTAGLIPTDALGPVADIGLGFRLVFVTLGLRARFGTFANEAPDTPNWTMSTIDGELGFHVPLGAAEPYIMLGGGYTSAGGVSANGDRPEGIGVHGWNARVGLGMDYYITRTFSVGGSLQGELLAVTPDGVSLADLTGSLKINTQQEARQRVSEATGTSGGLGVLLTAGAGVHF